MYIHTFNGPIYIYIYTNTHILTSLKLPISLSLTLSLSTNYCVCYVYLQVKWEPSEDRGPNGALGKGTFDPSFSVALLVTIYGVSWNM